MALESLYKLGELFIPGAKLLPQEMRDALAREQLTSFGANLLRESSQPGATLGGALGAAYIDTRESATEGLDSIGRLQQLEMVKLQTDVLREALRRKKGLREAVSEFAQKSGGANRFPSVAAYYAALSQYLLSKGYPEEASQYATLSKTLQPKVSPFNLPGGGGTILLDETGKPVGALPYVAQPEKSNEKFDVVYKLSSAFQKDAGAPLTEAARAYQGIIATLSQATGPGDVASTYQFIKLLDPGSVVRPGELELMEAAKPIYARLYTSVRKVVSGQTLTERERRHIAETARELFKISVESYRPVVETYRRRAEQFGVDPSLVLSGIPDVEALIKAPLPGKLGEPSEESPAVSPAASPVAPPAENSGSPWDWLRRR